MDLLAAYSMSTCHSPVRSAAGAAAGGSLRRARARQDGVQPIGDDPLLAGRHHVGRDGDAGLSLAAPREGGDARRAVQELPHHLLAGEAEARSRSQRTISEGVLFERPLGCSTEVVTPGTRAHALRDVVEPRDPALQLGLVVALHPHLDGHQHPDGFLLPDLQAAGEAVMGRAVDPGRLDQVLAPEQQARRSAVRAGTCRRCSRRGRRRPRGGRWERSGPRRRRRRARARRAALAAAATTRVSAARSRRPRVRPGCRRARCAGRRRPRARPTVETSITRTPTARSAASYTLRECAGDDDLVPAGSRGGRGCGRAGRGCRPRRRRRWRGSGRPRNPR